MRNDFIVGDVIKHRKTGREFLVTELDYSGAKPYGKLHNGKMGWLKPTWKGYIVINKSKLFNSLYNKLHE